MFALDQHSRKSCGKSPSCYVAVTLLFHLLTIAAIKSFIATFLMEKPKCNCIRRAIEKEEKDENISANRGKMQIIIAMKKEEKTFLYFS